MSVRVMTAVWELPLPDSEKIVLLALADCANDEGHCWPSMATLARKCSKSDRTVQAAIKSLVDGGHLTRREVAGKGCNYTVHPKRAGEPGPFHYVYRTTNAVTGEFYVGARSCHCSIEDDTYVGSGEWVKQQIAAGAPLSKAIVETYSSRDDLAHGEKGHTESVISDPLCRNRKVATPETLSGRNAFGAKRATGTPEAASDKPSKNHQGEEAKASPPSRAKPKSMIAEDWQAPAVADLPPKARACAEQWTRASYETHAEAFHCYWRSERKLKGDWTGTWGNRIISLHSQVMRDQKYGNAPTDTPAAADKPFDREEYFARMARLEKNGFTPDARHAEPDRPRTTGPPRPIGQLVAGIAGSVQH